MYIYVFKVYLIINNNVRVDADRNVNYKEGRICSGECPDEKQHSEATRNEPNNNMSMKEVIGNAIKSFTYHSNEDEDDVQLNIMCIKM